MLYNFYDDFILNFSEEIYYVFCYESNVLKNNEKIIT